MVRRTVFPGWESTVRPGHGSPSGHIHLNHPLTILSSQLILQFVLNPGITNFISTRQETKFREVLLEGGRDGTQESDDLGGQFPGRILPTGLTLIPTPGQSADFPSTARARFSLTLQAMAIDE